MKQKYTTYIITINKRKKKNKACKIIFNNVIYSQNRHWYAIPTIQKDVYTNAIFFLN